MFWMKRNKLVPLLHLTAVPGKKSPKGMGTHHMEISPSYYVIKGDQRKRTCTVRSYKKGKLQAKYRTVPLDSTQFDSLMSATTFQEVENILINIDYYVIR
jgi:hypothetical protein